MTGEPGGFYLGNSSRVPKTSRRGVIKQDFFSKKGKARGNGDAALTGDPPVTFKGSSGQEKTFRREPDLKNAGPLTSH